MAKSDDNIVTKGLRGLVGKMLVFRQRGDKTVVASRPKKSTKPFTPEQEAVKERFREAAAYAKSAISDPLTKAAYQEAAKPGQSAYNVAFADYFNAPVLKQIEVSQYNGQIGSVIRARVIDDFQVVSVHVAVLSFSDEPVEDGMAVAGPNGLDWVYTATVNNPQPGSSKIVFTATDLPGNTTKAQIEL